MTSPVCKHVFQVGVMEFQCAHECLQVGMTTSPVCKHVFQVGVMECQCADVCLQVGVRHL